MVDSQQVYDRTNLLERYTDASFDSSLCSNNPLSRIYRVFQTGCNYAISRLVLTVAKNGFHNHNLLLQGN